ncbi:MAG: hypothetical protein IJT94_09655 [Oscillibacter sp.]|nr:hypothetical protein [Oscillibacter sp.]
MNYFEQELRRLFGDGQVIDAPSFVGRACLGTLGNHLRVRAEFVTTGVHDHYTALRVKIINPKADGEIDSLLLRFREIWGRKPVPGNPNFPNGVEPYIWVDRGEAKWYAYTPTRNDMDLLRQQVHGFLEVYRDRTQEQERDTAIVVYLCAPLQGDVKANVEFVRTKAREELDAGNIPVCVHFLFPPIAKTNQPKQVKAARDMGLQMLEGCQEVHVYGQVWTHRMWDEIHHAEQLGIPVLTDQAQLDRYHGVAPIHTKQAEQSDPKQYEGGVSVRESKSTDKPADKKKRRDSVR